MSVTVVYIVFTSNTGIWNHSFAYFLYLYLLVSPVAPVMHCESE